MASYVRARPSLDDDPICTTRDASHILGVSVSTAQTWMERGELSSWKTPGGHRRCRLSSITRLQNIVESSKDGAHSQQATELAGEFRVAINRDYPLPVNEEKRLLALAGSRLMDSAHEHAYDRITWLATRFCRIRERRRVNRVNCGARTQDESICSTSKGCVFLST